ncbi:MAG: alpha-D-ribose 1-methylphosphonate 5-triphosphate diphosphatase [Actinomycetota bacterium]|nr:alpha-D-ribose 1-methylphosphonate 5-triphosphate diphosphatase [Actinomycetota bacterium]
MAGTLIDPAGGRPTVLDRVRVIPGGGRPGIGCATVVLRDDGVVDHIVARTGEPEQVLMPAAVDLHLDNLRERRRPRATVVLDQASVLIGLDAECAAAGIGTVCLSARCEHSPGKGIETADALALAELLEELAPHLACDWRLHARCEVTDDRAVDALASVLRISSRVVLVSMMEHSTARTRFASAEEHRRFYAEDWGVSLDEVDALIAESDDGGAAADDRRREVAKLASTAGVTLASHDDRNPDDVEQGHELGARVAEFPLTVAAATRARELGMATVLGAPNAVRGRSTSPGNLLATDAVRAGLCDVLCSDYLPSSLPQAPWALDAAGVAPIGAAVDLVSVNPAAALGLASPAIAVGQPLTATLRRRVGNADIGMALWRDGHLVFDRSPAATRPIGVG